MGKDPNIYIIDDISFYHIMLGFNPGKSAIGIYMIFIIKSILCWCVITNRKQRQVKVYNAHENSIQIIYGCAIGDLLYVDKTCIHCNLDYKKYGPYMITEVFKIVPFNSR